MAIHSVPRTVRFQEVDAAGIVFFGRVYEYFHDALFDYLDSRGVSVARILDQGEWGLPIVHSEADYAVPMRFGDPLVVAIESGTVGRTSLAVEYMVRSGRDESIVHCRGKTVSACIDRSTFRSRELPAEVRAAFTFT
jgi:1,4-dihydroxy-2-naphthoyl-CoA hydrolase